MTSPSPIACRMDALTPAQRARRREVLTLLEERTIEVVETEDGLAFQLRNQADTPALAGEFIGYEAACCPFLRFELTVAPDGGPIRLGLGGGQGVRDFLRATFTRGAALPETS